MHAVLRRTISRLSAILFLAGVGFIPNFAVAVEAEPPVGNAPQCAVLEKMSGRVQILNAARTEIIHTAPGVAVPCGSWLSVESGWALLKHKDGFTIHAGLQSFIQLVDLQLEKTRGDHLVVYRGSIFAEAGEGSGELRAITPNARARMTHGKLLLSYYPSEEESQLISIKSQASLENRFQSDRRIVARAGEATSLNFKQLRVVPSTPKAVAGVALRERLALLKIDENDRMEAMKLNRERRERKFAIAIETQKAIDAGDRKPAGLEPDPREPQVAEAKPVDPLADHLKSRWYRKIAGGDKNAEQILFRNEAGERGVGPQRGTVVRVTDPLAGQKLKHLQAEQVERERLMDELSRIQPD